MLQETEQSTPIQKLVRRDMSIAFGGLLVLCLVVAAVLVGTTHSLVPPRPSGSGWPCLASLASPWSPVGRQWHLTITFLTGWRQGQTERSEMVFAPTGTITATFPGTSASAPPTMPPARGGHWCMTGPNTFQYAFRDPLQWGGPQVAYVQTFIAAYLTSATTYEAGGIGAAYNAQTGQPIPQEYTITQTFAHA